LTRPRPAPDPNAVGALHGGFARDDLARIDPNAPQRDPADMVSLEGNPNIDLMPVDLLNPGPPPDPNAVGALHGGYARDQLARIDPNAPPPEGPQIQLMEGGAPTEAIARQREQIDKFRRGENAAVEAIAWKGENYSDPKVQLEGEEPPEVQSARQTLEKFAGRQGGYQGMDPWMHMANPNPNAFRTDQIRQAQAVVDEWTKTGSTKRQKQEKKRVEAWRQKLPRFTTDAQVDAAIASGKLTSGMWFIAPNGKEHVLQ